MISREGSQALLLLSFSSTCYCKPLKFILGVRSLGLSTVSSSRRRSRLIP